MNEGTSQRVSASFEVVDDLLWQAVAGRLPKLGRITLARSGRIGPLVELAMAGVAVPGAYQAVSPEPPVYHQIERALRDGMISGSSAHDRAGAFPLLRLDPGGDEKARLAWDQWAEHAENAAVAAGLAKRFVGGLMCALGELQDNFFEHSGLPTSGVVAYAAKEGTFEFVVADAGRGVLASLRENPDLSAIADSGVALRVAASDGASRHASSSGHGYGIGQLFRALAHDAAELRFRSGDYALRHWGDAPSLTGHIELAQKAWLDGLTISVRCTSAGLIGASYEARTMATLWARRSSIGAPCCVGYAAHFRRPDSARYARRRRMVREKASVSIRQTRAKWRRRHVSLRPPPRTTSESGRPPTR